MKLTECSEIIRLEFSAMVIIKIHIYNRVVCIYYDNRKKHRHVWYLRIPLKETCQFNFHTNEKIHKYMYILTTVYYMNSRATGQNKRHMFTIRVVVSKSEIRSSHIILLMRLAIINVASTGR